MATVTYNVIAKVGADISGFTTGMGKADTALAKTAQSFGKTGKALTMGVTVPIAAVGALSAKSAVEFESAFAGVRKTVTASESTFKSLETGIIDMSKKIPVAAVEIANIGEAAGQLGIKTKNIMSFSRVMADLGVATNMSSDQAATALARLANITQMPQTEFDRLGSVIVALGNNMATTESEIVDMGLRLAGAGKQVGMSEAEIMGLSAALSSVGIEAEAGGSAFSKVMVDMQLAVEQGGQGLQDFADVAGMTSEQFAKAYKDDAAGALVSFVTGLGTMDSRGKSAIATLDNMGISEVRMRDALLRSAGAGDLMTQAIQLGTDAWKENNALTKEAEQRYQTTESKIKIAKNQITAAGIELGGVLLPAVANTAKAVGNLATKFAGLNPETQKTILKIAGVAAAIGPTLLLTSKMITTYTKLKAAYTTVSTGVKAFSASQTALNSWISKGTILSVKDSSSKLLQAGATTTVGTASAGASVGVRVLGTAVNFALGPIGIAVMVAGLLATAFMGLGGSSEKAKKEVKSLADVDIDKTLTKMSNDTEKSNEKITKSFADMSSKVNVSMIKMQTSMTDQSTADKFFKDVTAMTDKAIKIIDSQTGKTVKIFADAYQRIDGLTNEEGVSINERIMQDGERRKEIVRNAQAEITAIYEASKNNNYKLTADQATRVQELEQQIANTSLETVSKTKAKALSMEALYNSESASKTLEATKQMTDIKLKAAKEDFDNQVQTTGQLLNALEQQYQNGTITYDEYVRGKLYATEELKSAQIEMARIELETLQIRKDATKEAIKANDAEIESLEKKLIKADKNTQLTENQREHNKVLQDEIDALKGVNGELDKDLTKTQAKIDVSKQLNKNLGDQTLQYKNVTDAIKGASGETENFAVAVGGNLTRAIANTELDSTMRAKLSEMSLVLDEGKGMAGAKGTALMEAYKTELSNVNVYDSAYTKALEVAMGLAPGTIKSKEEGFNVMQAYIGGIGSVNLGPIAQAQGASLSNNFRATGSQGAGLVASDYANYGWWALGNSAGATAGSAFKAALQANSATSIAIRNHASGTGDFLGYKTEFYARGGLITKPHLGVVGEAGPEYIVPLNPAGIAGFMDFMGANSKYNPGNLVAPSIPNGYSSPVTSNNNSNVFNIQIDGSGDPRQVSDAVIKAISKRLGSQTRGGVQFRGI